MYASSLAVSTRPETRDPDRWCGSLSKSRIKSAAARIGVVFPAGRKISSEFCRLAAISAFSGINSSSNSSALQANSLLSRRREVFQSGQGPFSPGQGIYPPRQGTLPLWLASRSRSAGVLALIARRRHSGAQALAREPGIHNHK
jgi:hypothetical protein